MLKSARCECIPLYMVYCQSVVCDYGSCLQDADLACLRIPEQKYLHHLNFRPDVLALLPGQHVPSDLCWGALGLLGHVLD